jgi:hypothetical protein
VCRSIHTLHNFEPPARPDEVGAAALQYVRKVSGMTRPSIANQAAFDRAVATVTAATEQLIASLVATTPPHSREIHRLRARARWERRQAAG